MLIKNKCNWRWPQEYEIVIIKKEMSAFQVVFSSAAISKIKLSVYNMETSGEWWCLCEGPKENVTFITPLKKFNGSKSLPRVKCQVQLITVHADLSIILCFSTLQIPMWANFKSLSTVFFNLNLGVVGAN